MLGEPNPMLTALSVMVRKQCLRQWRSEQIWPLRKNLEYTISLANTIAAWLAIEMRQHKSEMLPVKVLDCKCSAHNWLNQFRTPLAFSQTGLGWGKLLRAFWLGKNISGRPRGSPAPPRRRTEKVDFRP